MNAVITEAWDIYQTFMNQPFAVTPSIPILFFGDSDAYFDSEVRIITVGLNPSWVEFPPDDAFYRFPIARSIDPTTIGHGSGYGLYLNALNAYFQTNPYRTWFGSFEPLLNGLDASFYNKHAYTALHTDICSPLATNPTWSGLSREQKTTLVTSGNALWRQLVNRLAPHVIIMSVARQHVETTGFNWVDDWRCFHRIEEKADGSQRKDPYTVIARRTTIDQQKALVIFGPAAITPFGAISNPAKYNIGTRIKEMI